MKNKSVQCAVAALVLLFCSCSNDYTPKPAAYLRIDTPEHKYWLVDTLRTNPGDTLIFGSDTAVVITGHDHLFPFIFEANECVELAEKDAPRGEVWLDINYPQWNGVVFLTYKRIRSLDDLRGQIDTSARLLEKHYQVASGVDEHRFDSDDGTVHAVTWHLLGAKVASTYQFYATDSVSNFLRGGLFLNQTPNNDSLAPVLEYIQADIDHLIETLRWRQ
ncbi:MAG: hypothetical protein IKM79_02815 [Bacteroidales bacterium]|nr:hypothetical protein [Bacteroidales bacterium]